MEETFPHLTIQREAPINEKRPRGGFSGIVEPADIRGHCNGLQQKHC